MFAMNKKGTSAPHEGSRALQSMVHLGAMLPVQLVQGCTSTPPAAHRSPCRIASKTRRKHSADRPVGRARPHRSRPTRPPARGRKKEGGTTTPTPPTCQASATPPAPQPPRRPRRRRRAPPPPGARRRATTGAAGAPTAAPAAAATGGTHTAASPPRG